MVTSDAITTMKQGMRTISGMRFLMSDIMRLLKTSTAIVASPMLIPFMALEVVPSVGHMPNRSTKVGFSLMIPLRSTLKLFIVLSSYALLFIILLGGSAIGIGVFA